MRYWLFHNPDSASCRSSSPMRNSTDTAQKGSLRPIAFAAVVFSTVSTTACLLTFPLVFHYVQTLQATVQGEVEYCKSRSRDMWREMVDVELVSSLEDGENEFESLPNGSGHPSGEESNASSHHSEKRGNG
ncbi:cuticle collagen 14 [Ditylenchus destructor]|uniref:Cuticle collagen 14 n=1 Tax=Ditylenchus destructor TaxID=166010 RepID=A0AAD4R1G6_9BILA|nr:cuticle collagen 14 [Ditylenchus destructor]